MIQKEHKQLKEIKKLYLKHCAPFTDCNSEINNTQVCNAKDFDFVMPMCNLVE